MSSSLKLNVETEDAPVKLTAAAAEQLRRHLEQQGTGADGGVRLGIKPTGCSGLSYHLEYAQSVAPQERVFEVQGVPIIVDPENLPFIQGTELDYVRQGLNASFEFRNPNERDRCGCGESFRV